MSGPTPKRKRTVYAVTRIVHEPESAQVVYTIHATRAGAEAEQRAIAQRTNKPITYPHQWREHTATHPIVAYPIQTGRPRR